MTKRSSAQRRQRAPRPVGPPAVQPRSAARRWALPAMLAVAAAAVAVIAILGASARPAGPPAGGPASQAAADSGRAAGGLALGSATAAVELDEYGDFQCTSCESFFRNTEPQLKAAYIDTGRVRLVWHDFPWIGQESLDAANAARCAADQGRFWEYHDLLYQSQGAENSGAFSRARLEALASRLGLDSAQFNACVDAGAHLAAVRADLATASSSGFPGTPAFVLGAQKIFGAQPYAVFAQALDAAIGR